MKMWPMTRSCVAPLGLTLLLTVSATAAEVTTDGGIKVESDDGNFSAQIGGRIQIDAAAYDDGSVCDCGCGAFDPDCPTGEGCKEPGCSNRDSGGLETCDVCHDPDGRTVACP